MFVGAYAASPCHSEWRPEDEKQFLGELAGFEVIRGLELPFFGNLHKHDSDWLLEHLKPEWTYVLTCIPGAMENLKLVPDSGLASNSDSGRSHAIQFAERARQAVLKLNRHFGRCCVRAVEIHSGPKQSSGIKSSTKSFKKSLIEVSGWDWDGASLMVEHCDRYIEGQEPAKGFLSIDDEISAIQSISSPKLSVLINWGRSALEDRNADAPIEHIKKAQKAKLLGGLIFSGVTLNDPQYGNWADSHAPFGAAGGVTQVLGTTPSSLMTLERVRHALIESDGLQLPVLGFKIQALPKTLSVGERVSAIQSWIQFFNRACG